MNLELLSYGILVFLILLVSLSVHEWAHASAADRLGDPTPRERGRVTLNPFAHIDFLGTIILPLFMVFFAASPLGGRLFLIGWGKPVPIDPRNFKQLVRDDLLVTMAGPASNVALCFIGSIAGGVLAGFDPGLWKLVELFITINAILAIFNLIPIPPLDGSHLLRHAVRMRPQTYVTLSRWGFLILIVLINIPFFREAMATGITLTSMPFLGLARLISFAFGS